MQRSQATLEFWGNKAGAWFSLILGGLFVCGALGMLFLSLSHTEAFFSLIGIILLLPGSLLLFAGRKQLKLAAHPLFSLSEGHIDSHLIASPLPLCKVDSFQVRGSSETLTVELRLCSEYTPDITTKRLMQPIRFDPNKHAVIMILGGNFVQSDENGKTKMACSQVAERIVQYLYANSARDELAKLQESH
ncbi:hypothetical protein [Metakosakonia massiliensis]|uniref:Uncharacterized protein n=1 Tax=Phytobacter massiliensis TaxID=1485952 RepID=A0A6N3GSN6_9ENTR